MDIDFVPKKETRGTTEKRLTEPSDSCFLNPSGWLERDALLFIIFLYASLFICIFAEGRGWSLQRCLPVVFRSDFPIWATSLSVPERTKDVTRAWMRDPVHLQQKSVNHREKRTFRNEVNSGREVESVVQGGVILFLDPIKFVSQKPL